MLWSVHARNKVPSKAHNPLHTHMHACSHTRAHMHRPTFLARRGIKIGRPLVLDLLQVLGQPTAGHRRARGAGVGVALELQELIAHEARACAHGMRRDAKACACAFTYQREPARLCKTRKYAHTCTYVPVRWVREAEHEGGFCQPTRKRAIPSAACINVPTPLYLGDISE